MSAAVRIPIGYGVRGFLQRPPEFLQETRERYGDVCLLRVGPAHLYFFHHPDAVEELLVRRARELHKDRVTVELTHSLGEGLLTTDGDEWKRRRRIAAPTLTRKHIEHYADDMVRYACDAVAHLSTTDDATRDLHHDMMALTLRVVARTLFATELEDEVSTIGDAMDRVMGFWDLELNSWRRFVPWAIPLRNRREVRAPLAMLDATIQGLIRARRAAGGEGDDLMSRLIAAGGSDPDALSDQDLLNEAKTFFAAGHETTAIALSMALYFVATHPAVAAQVDAELEAVLSGSPPRLEHVDALPYCRAVIDEALRLHPPAWIVGREAPTRMTFAGVSVPKGAQLLTSAFAIHRDPRWWDNPDQFDPSRWLDPRERPRFSYFPFGGGPRVCIGNHFAMMESVLLFATLWQGLRFELAPGYRLERLAAITMRPRHGMPMRVVGRRR